MSAQPTITVQFSPFRLALLRDNAGNWLATLSHGDGFKNAPIVTALSTPIEAPPRVSAESGQPRLLVGSAAFAMPMRQLNRIAEWLEKHRNAIDFMDPAVIVSGDIPPPLTTFPGTTSDG